VSASGLPESLEKGRASDREVAEMSRKTRILCGCSVCKTTYVNAGYAWRCERWHWREK
jgi:hypothetical protein